MAKQESTSIMIFNIQIGKRTNNKLDYIFNILTFGAASNIEKSRFKFSSNSKIAATFPHLKKKKTCMSYMYVLYNVIHFVLKIMISFDNLEGFHLPTCHVHTYL